MLSLKPDGLGATARRQQPEGSSSSSGGGSLLLLGGMVSGRWIEEATVGWCSRV